MGTVGWDQGLTVLFALATAGANAVALTAQHVASARRRDGRSLAHLLRGLVREPLWLLGWVGLAGSLVFQALALHFGPMSEVQPLLISELVLAQVLRRSWLHDAVGPRAWTSAVVTAIGLTAFLLASRPHGGVTPAASAWVGPTAGCLAVVLALGVVARHGPPRRRAGSFAVATGIAWALEATFIKAATDALAAGGLTGLLHSWELYALVVVGVVGLVVEQAALHVGPLSVSQPLIVIVDPLVSVALGITLYGERLASGGVDRAVAILAALAVIGGVVSLTRATPEERYRV